MAHSLDFSRRMAWITGGSDVWGKSFAKTLDQAGLAVVQTRQITDQTVVLRVHIGGVPG